MKDGGDLEVIRRLEKKLGITLEQLAEDEVLSDTINGYFRDAGGRVKGLNLDEQKQLDLSLLRDLPFLSKLSLNGCSLVDVSPLGALTSLTALDLSENQVVDVSPLGALTSLTALDLNQNQVVNVSPLGALTSLTALNLWKNQVVDLSPLGALISLTSLYLGYNQVADVSPLGALTSLTALILNSNQVVDMSPLGALTSLTDLNLGDNQVVDVSLLGALTSLTSLGWRSNQVVDVSPLGTLTQLKSLELSENKIKNLPQWVCRFRGEIKWDSSFYFGAPGLFLEGNPLESPPVEVVKRGARAVQTYFKELEQNAVPLQQAKLLFVGSGEVGKTTLMRTLTEPGFRLNKEDIGKEPSTHGIEIKPWELTATLEGDNGAERTLTLHTWDFGGQEIYRSTHQFFLTKRSLYILVWEARKDEDTNPFDYWLDAVRLLSANSPVIVVMNKAEARSKPIDEAVYTEKFKNIAAFLKVSCLDRTGIGELHRVIRQTLAPMPHLKDLLPKTWLDIRDKLAALKEDYITSDRYYDICRPFGLDNERADHLGDYLHDLGAILRFRTDPVLEKTLVLKPEWATEAVYRLIDTPEILANKGRFDYGDLENIWDPAKYPADKYRELILLMEKFELCFNFTHTHTYIVPGLAPGKRPELETAYFQAADTLRLQYTYDFMPRGIVSRLIARNYYFIEKEKFWQNGVELGFEGSTALVLGDPPRRRLQILARGPQKKDLLSIIRKELEAIHQTLNMSKEEEHYKEEAPCNCTHCLGKETAHLFPLEAIKKMSEIGRSLTCFKSYREVAPEVLLQGYERPKTGEGSIWEDLETCASQLQGKALSIHRGEDNYTGVLALLLNARGYMVHEQTLWGRAPSGKNLGELDLKIDNAEGKTLAIGEAFMLSCLDRTVISSHLEKIFGYDPNGLLENFILVYVESKNFEKLWKKYLAHLKKVEYPCPLEGKPELPGTGFTAMRSARTTHLRQGKKTYLYHLFINMPVKK